MSGIAHRIIQRAAQRPYHHLPGYMRRYWLFGGSHPKRDDRDDASLGWKRSLLDALVGRFVAARVHDILRSDLERHLHNHPWPYITVILRGGYHEVTAGPDGKEVRKWYGPGSVLFRGYKHFHRLEKPTDGPCVTLFFMLGRHAQPWGYDTPHGFILASQYKSYCAAVRSIERARQAEGIVSEFLGIDDWQDGLIAPLELVHRAQRWLEMRGAG